MTGRNASNLSDGNEFSQSSTRYSIVSGMVVIGSGSVGGEVALRMRRECARRFLVAMISNAGSTTSELEAASS